MARDQVELPVAGGKPANYEPSPIQPAWQRWNDYGIGLLLEGGTKGGQKGELKQAEQMFRKVAELGPADGWVNLARVYQKEGRIPEALAAHEAAARHKEPAAPWVINWLTGQINARNGHIDEAIESFESVLATKVPERKFDFSLDYEVINELASARYARARIEAVASPDRQAYLRKTIADYRRTLAIDSEDVAAHYGLGLAYGDPAWKANVPDDPASGPTPIESSDGKPVDPDDLLKWASSIADPGVSEAERRAGALRLTREIVRFMEGTPPRFLSRLEPLHDVVEILGPAWEAETNPSLTAALAKPLEMAHKRLHERLKPDETAEGRAFALARQKDPAANQNAQSIVIHSLHRPGAPGIDPTAGTLAPRSPTTASTTALNAAPASENAE
jgi:tetratricopeptide (TPR) repeat protein